MRTFTKTLAFALLLALAGLCLPSLSEAQQNSLLQTTLAAAIPSTPSTNPQGSSQTFMTVASVPTGVTGLSLNPTTTLNQQNQWQAYIDRELVTVVSVNGTTLNIQRGQGGTVASPHASGTMVLFGRALWFYTYDPGAPSRVGVGGIGGGACTAAQTLVTPWLNVLTGAQWLCSTVTLTWVPGWNNGAAGGSTDAPTTTVASVAGATLPSGPLFTVTGTNAITSWTIPLGFNGTSTGGGCFTTIPTGIWTWTAAGNISTAGTVTAGNSVPVVFCWNALTQKWVPSRIA